MRTAYEVIVVGAGGLGSAATYWASLRTGGDVLALERFELGHVRGSSQDHSRIIRRSYHDPIYIDLATASYAAWHEVEAASGVQLVTKTGGLDMELLGTGGPKSLSACAASMAAAGIPFEELSSRDLRERFPQFTLPEDARALYQEDGGLVDARKSIATHLALARGLGATVIDRCPVRALRPLGESSVEVVTDSGTFTAGQVLVAAGAWTNPVLESVGVRFPLTVTQEQVTYFATPHLREFAPDRFPVWIWRGPQGFYGFPVYGEVATKAGQDAGGPETTADDRTFEPDPAAHHRLLDFLGAHIPRFLGPELATKTCLYTMPPDRHFVLDKAPGAPRVTVAVDAGHAFKFASLFGRILSDLALDGRTDHEIAPFRADRLALTDPDFVPFFRNEAVVRRS